MTTVYGANLSAAILAGSAKADGSLIGGNVRVQTETITLAAQATSNTIPVATLDIGEAFLFGIINTTVTLASATIAIGITGTTAKYRAAATFTATDTPTLFGKTAAVGVKLTAKETIFITIAVVALPSSGTLQCSIFSSRT